MKKSQDGFDLMDALLGANLYETWSIQKRLETAEEERHAQRRLRNMLYELRKLADSEVLSGRSNALVRCVHITFIKSTLENLQHLFAQFDSLDDRRFADELVEFVNAEHQEALIQINRLQPELRGIIETEKERTDIVADHKTIIKEIRDVENFIRNPPLNVDDESLIEPTLKSGDTFLARLSEKVKYYISRIRWEGNQRIRKEFMDYQEKLPERQTRLRELVDKKSDIEKRLTHCRQRLANYDDRYKGILAALGFNEETGTDPLYRRIRSLFDE